MAVTDLQDDELEALAKRAQQKFLQGQLQQETPESNLGLQLAAGGLDLLSKSAQDSQDIMSIATGVKGPNLRGPGASDALQRTLAARQTSTRQKALDDMNSMSAIQRLVDAKREREQSDLQRRQTLAMGGYELGADGMPVMVKGGKADLENRKLLSEIGSSAATRDLDRRYKEAQIAKLNADAVGGDGETGRLSTFVPGVGQALTKEDAKNLKDAAVMKDKLDRQLQEMIDLRRSKGAEFLDRAAVARGQQLSKDILLTYKNLQKLGVLSKSDEDIINAIIPSDPLETTISSVTGLGDDPILSNLEKFKADNQKDFDANLAARLRPGQATSGGFPRQVRKDGQVATVANAQELNEARAEGWN